MAPWLTRAPCNSMLINNSNNQSEGYRLFDATAPLCGESVAWQVEDMYKRNAVRFSGFDPVYFSGLKAILSSNNSESAMGLEGITLDTLQIGDSVLCEGAKNGTAKMVVNDRK